MTILNRFLLYAFYLLLAYMPFHIFLSQWLSTYTGGLDYWKVGKDVFLAVAVIFGLGLVWYKRRFKDRLFWTFVAGSAAYFLIHLLVWAANPQIDSQAALLATAYNSRLLAYAVLGWSVGLLARNVRGPTFHKRTVFKVAIAVSSVVAGLGVLQYFLPKDLLTHFGYTLERGVMPAFFIDAKPDLPRIMSTLRDPNSLGAYLILPITLLWAAWLKYPKTRTLLSGLLLLHGLALFLTFSRSAWVGAFLALAIFTIWTYKTQTLKFTKKYWPLLLLAVSCLLLATFLLRDQYVVQNYVFHSDENTQLTDSNNLHAIYAQKGLEGVAAMPFGHGPGTAGLVSIQTDNVVLTENYFIQIAYEVGLHGLILLLALMWFVLRILYKRNDPYAKILIAAFIGITFCNFLLHTWSNEAVACQWWLLAGILVGYTAKEKRGVHG